MKSGFWQLPMHTDSIKYTAFTTPIGNFEFLVAPFGICNIPAEFACMCTKILNDLDFAETYVDDITTFSNEFEQHLNDLQTLFDRLRKFNIKLNPKKCKFFKKEIKILGHILNQFGISTDPDKVRALLKMPFPATIKELYSFSGLVSYFRKFIRYCSSIMAPLLNQLRLENQKNNNKHVINNKESLEAFNKIKEILATYPILRHADLSKEFIVYTDASGYAMGAILAQKDEHGNEYVVMFANKRFNKHQELMPISLKECLSMMFAIEIFKDYVYDKKFTLVTGHKALIYLKNLKNNNQMLLRFSLLLDVLDYDIVYKKGETHTNVDALYRLIEIKQDDTVLAITRSQTKSLAENNTNNTNTTNNIKPADSTSSTVEKKSSNEITNTNKVKPTIEIKRTTESQENIIKVNNNKESDDLNSTDEEGEVATKDPFQNKNLLHYLKHLKLKSGISKSESKKIIKMAQNYTFNNINIIYTKNNVNKVVPPIEKRIEIIKSAHLIGHFQTDTTYNRLREKYYWPKMFEQIKSVIAQCAPCIRNEPHQASHLKAQALSIVNIFDRVSIDLVLGLPTSKTGNNIICVMVEHLTGFCMAKPVKSKEAKEVVQVLWNWI
jgi:hypothetical protein